MSAHEIEVKINGQVVVGKVAAKRLLSEFLRDDLHLTGTKRGCETGVCGACSVQVDGEVVKSCLCLAVQVDGKSVTTVEGLSPRPGLLHTLQESFMRCGGLQCGYCTPGFLVAAEELLRRNPMPTEQEVRHGLNGNLCRCTGYQGIVDAVLDATGKANGH